MKLSLLVLCAVLIVTLTAQTPVTAIHGEKTGAIAKLQPDGRWAVEGGLSLIRPSVKLYRNGLRQTLTIDYTLDAANPHYLRPAGEPWNSDDIVVMDYFY